MCRETGAKDLKEPQRILKSSQIIHEGLDWIASKETQKAKTLFVKVYEEVLSISIKGILLQGKSIRSATPPSPFM